MRLLFQGSLRGLAVCRGQITLLAAVKIAPTKREKAACGFVRNWASGELCACRRWGEGGSLWATSCDHMQNICWRWLFTGQAGPDKLECCCLLTLYEDAGMM